MHTVVGFCVTLWSVSNVIAILVQNLCSGMMVQCQRRQCMHVYGTRLPTKPTNFTECFGEISTGDALCALAESRLVPTKAGSPESPDAVQVCVVTLFNTSEAWLQGNALAALSSADSS